MFRHRECKVSDISDWLSYAIGSIIECLDSLSGSIIVAIKHELENACEILSYNISLHIILQRSEWIHV
jgi:hypothetical protein